MGTENSTTETTSSSIVAGVSSLIVLMVIIVMVTSLLNNKNISALETRIEQLETNLQSAQTADLTTSSALQEPDKDDTKILKMATVKQDIPLNTVINQDARFNKLEKQLGTLTKQLKTVTGKVNSFGKQLNQQANSLQTAIKNETNFLTKTQNDEAKKLKIQLKSINQNIANLQREGKQLKTRLSKTPDVSNHVKNQDNNIKELTVKLQNLTTDNSNQIKQQLEQEHQISQLKVTLETSVSEQFQEQSDKINSLETQFQMLIGGLVGSIEE